MCSESVFLDEEMKKRKELIKGALRQSEENFTDVCCLSLLRTLREENCSEVCTIVHNTLMGHISRAAFETLDAYASYLLFYLGFLVFVLILDSNHPITCHGLFKFLDALD
jgi:hypothetical protein